MIHLPNDGYERDWGFCGEIDPYYGVLSAERFRTRNLTAEIRNDFFQSGQEYVARLIEKINSHIDGSFRPSCVLDFGCGVGRLVIPFAKISQQVTGIDISDGMLAEARANCNVAQLSNVSFAKSLDEVNGSFDLVHSYIVLQHIPPAIGVRLIEKLLAKVASNGIVALHLTYLSEGSRLRRSVAKLRSKSKLLHRSLNLLQHRAVRESLLQMNEYDLNRVMGACQANGFSEMHVLFTRHGNSSGVMLIGRNGGSDYES